MVLAGVGGRQRGGFIHNDKDTRAGRALGGSVSQNGLGYAAVRSKPWILVA